jgi:Rod binding domain-containing protein
MNVGIPYAELLTGTSEHDPASFTPSSLAPSSLAPANPANEKQSSAAKDFEALLIDQILRSSREEDSGWLGTGDDDSSSTAFGLGEEELAKAMASAGGFGLQKLIAQGLASKKDQESRP